MNASPVPAIRPFAEWTIGYVRKMVRAGVRHADGSVSTVSDIVPHFVRRIRRTEEEIAAIVAVAMQFPGACKVEAGA